MRYGPLSLSFGLLALACGLAGWHAGRVRIPGSAQILNWLDERGLVRAPDPARGPEWSSVSPLLVTDGSAIQWLVLHSWWFGAVAMLLAIWAVRKRENTLSLSIGFICGALSLAFFSFYSSVGSMLIGGIVVSLWRRRRDA